MSKNKKLFRATGLTMLMSSILLSGCGSDDENKLEAKPFTPEVSITGGQYTVNERDEVIIATDAFDKNGEIVSYQWSVKALTENAKALPIADLTQSQLSFATPDLFAGEESDYKITVTVEDNEGNIAKDSVVFTNKPYYQELKVWGRAFGLTYPDATVYVGYGQNQQTFIADETQFFSNGVFEVDLEIDETNYDSLVKLEINGREQLSIFGGKPQTINEQQVKLVSLLGDANSLIEQAGEDKVLDAIENFDVLVSTVTTAKYVLAQQLNNGEDISTKALFDQLYPFVDGSMEPSVESLYNQVLQLSVALSFGFGEDSIALPEGIDNLLSLATNNEAIANYEALITAEKFADRGEELASDPFYAIPRDTDFDGIIDLFDPDADGDWFGNDYYDYFATGCIDGYVVSATDENICTPTDRVDYQPFDRYKQYPVIADLKWLQNPRWSIWCVYRWHQQRSGDSLSPGTNKGNQFENDTETVDIKDFSCPQYNVEDQANLQYFTKLKSLDLSTSKVNDISTWDGLTELEELDLSTTQIRDFTSISNYTKLKKLNLSATGITDISFLTNLTNLEELNLSANSITDISPLLNNLKLKKLNLGANNISDIAGLTELTALIELQINGNNISTTPSFSSLNQLEFLDIANNELTSAANIFEATQLTHLNVSGNQLSSIVGIANLTLLKEFIAFENSLVDIAPLATVTQLTKLDLTRNNIVDISVLANLHNLAYLDLSNNQITDMSVINSDVKPADYLNIGYNPIIDASFMLTWPKISTTVETGTINHTALPITFVLTETLISCDFLFNETDGILNGIDQLEGKYTTSQNCEDSAGSQALFGPFNNTSMDLAFGFDSSTVTSKAGLLSGSLRYFESMVDYGPGINEINEGIYCFFHANAPLTDGNPQMTQPICWNGPSFARDGHGQRLCKSVSDAELEHFNTLGFDEFVANDKATRMACMNKSSTDQSLMFWVDFDQGPKPNKLFVNDFDNRNIATLIGSHFYENNQEVTYLHNQCVENSDGLFNCTFTSERVKQDINWVQDSPHGGFPECSGSKGETVATCTPRFLSPENVGEFDFSIDLLDYDLVPRPAWGDTCGGSSC